MDLLDDLALPIHNRWNAEEVQSRVESAKLELREQIKHSFGGDKTANVKADEGIIVGVSSSGALGQRNGLPTKVKSFLSDVRQSGSADGNEIGQFVGFSVGVLTALQPVVASITGTDLEAGATQPASGDGDEGQLAATYLTLMADAKRLKAVCDVTVAMSEADDTTLDFVSKEKLEAHRVALVDFLRRQLPLGVRPALNKLPPFLLRKLVADSEAFQW